MHTFNPVQTVVADPRMVRCAMLTAQLSRAKGCGVCRCLGLHAHTAILVLHMTVLTGQEELAVMPIITK